MGCGLGSGSLVPLSSSTGMTWILLCLLTLGDGVGIVDWGGLIITLGGGTVLPACVAFWKILANCRIACN
eukprot:8712137-Ditylum_brightwellii.AAC.1